MSAKRSIWAMVGKLLWTFFSLVLRLAAKLGSRWARNRLDQHDEDQSGNPISRALHRRNRR